MHVLATTAGQLDGVPEAVDLRQTPGDIVVLSAADSEIACLAVAHSRLASDRPSLRLANLLNLQHNYSVDLYLEKTLAFAKLIVIRLLGGASYWPYGVNEIEALARRKGILLAVLPGDARPDQSLAGRSTLPSTDCERLHRCLAFGGVENARLFLELCAHFTRGSSAPIVASEPPSRFGIYRNDVAPGDQTPRAAIVFYRSLLDGGQTAPIDALEAALKLRGIASASIYVSSLKDPECAAFVQEALAERPPDVILNTTGFAIGDMAQNPFVESDCPVIQTVLAGTSEASWNEGTHGLSARDLAMNIVLPEIDGRIMGRAVSFKTEQFYDGATECNVVTYKPVQDRVAFVADLASNWARLRHTPASSRRIAIVLANYPNKDGRIANGVGYDTPASTVAILQALAKEDYTLGPLPHSGNALIEILQTGRTNASGSRASSQCRLALNDYQRLFAELPERVRREIIARWGEPKDDPFISGESFHLPAVSFGNVIVSIQPARGYNLDPKGTYHDPALVPPHGYLAFYFWLRHEFKAQAVIHNGKHGNLEWLPGKANALSSACYPEIALGPLPQLYPFIVNDPGEGTQAKRRTSAVIVDHLTPPLTRAETYGPLKDLEALVDEYYLASGLDRRRTAALRKNILDLTRNQRLDVDAGFTGNDDDDLRRLDAYLCDLKEAQIRDGLHILGSSPQGRQETDLLVALTRVPRGLGDGRNASLIRALSEAFGFADFDPLTCPVAEPWAGGKPLELAANTSAPWRSNGDTVERLELFAGALLERQAQAPAGQSLSEVLRAIDSDIRPMLRSCGPSEMTALLRGLSGRFVAPGPSGAPTRGRLDVLPTGRNFFSLDNRTVPTPTAWALGEKSAAELLARHFQDFGQYPRAIGLSAWGTSNMRTGGDDIAQAMALIGAKPVWEPSSWRVTGFEILPIAKLGRPRVDVTLRISGFFRDAFPVQIELLDKVFRAAGALDEDSEDNPIAARMRSEAAGLVEAGASIEKARQMAGHRIFGSKPGAYGAGLQTLIDEKLWSERADLARAYVVWGAYAYGSHDQGSYDEAAFTVRLKRIDAVVHNQDNREHDLLDSDDYYQFEGGMTAAVEAASGARPRVYHNDHSRPERPVIRTLEDEIGRVVRSRAVNPKWIAGVKRHGYKGAFEIAATVDYLFAFAATTGAAKSHHFDLAYEAYLADDDTREFIARNNPAALKEIAERFEEAAARGLWVPRSNSAYDLLRSFTRGEAV